MSGRNRSPQRHLSQQGEHPAQQTSPQGEINLTAFKSELLSGPLPHPNLMAAYERSVPGSAERIIRMAEKEQEAVVAMEKGNLDLEKRRQSNERLGQLGAILTTIFLGGTAAYLALHGAKEVAIILAGSPLVSIVLAFLGQRHISRKKKD